MLSIETENGETVARIEDVFEAFVGGQHFYLGPRGGNVAEIVELDRPTAGRLGKLLLLFERDGNLDRAAEIFDEGPGPSEADQDIRGKVDELEFSATHTDKVLHAMLSRIDDLAGAIKKVATTQDNQGVRSAVAMEGLKFRMDAVEAGVREANQCVVGLRGYLDRVDARLREAEGGLAAVSVDSLPGLELRMATVEAALGSLTMTRHLPMVFGGPAEYCEIQPPARPVWIVATNNIGG